MLQQLLLEVANIVAKSCILLALLVELAMDEFEVLRVLTMMKLVMMMMAELSLFLLLLLLL